MDYDCEQATLGLINVKAVGPQIREPSITMTPFVLADTFCVSRFMV